MGDEAKYYTIQVKGTAYRFQPIAPKDFERIALVQSLSGDHLTMVRAVTRLLANSAGSEAWNELTNRYVDGELTIHELTTDVFHTLIARQKEDDKKTAPKKAASKKTAPKRRPSESAPVAVSDDAE